MSYNDFINDILSSRGRFSIPSGEYKERHHIIPRCLGGTDNEDNLIDLYPREHFVAHKLLAEENSDNKSVVCALWRMCNTKHGKAIMTPEEYETSRLLWYYAFAKAPKPESWKIKMRRPLSSEHKRKIGLANKGKKRPDLAEYNTRTKKGSKDSYETYLKKCAAQALRNSSENPPLARKVINLDTGEVFKFEKQAAASVGGSISGLSNYLNDENRAGISKYKGFKWAFYEENKEN